LVVNDVPTARWGLATGNFNLAIQNDGSGAWETRLLLTRNGNVGIGTTAPQRKLEVGESDVAGISFEGFTTSPNAGAIRFGDNTGWKLHIGRSREAVRGALNSGTSGVLMTIQDNGNVGIGTTDPAARLHVRGNVLANNIPSPSDTRLKTNVMLLTNVLEKLDRIHGVSFEWNALSESLGCTPGGKGIGVMAQEVEAVFPELVTTWGEEAYKAIDYGRLAAVLVEAIKELQAENAVLTQRLEAVEGRSH
jgi:hypothetical protein